jgi:hypothetical protein
MKHKMKLELIFPLVLAALDLAAAIVYLYKGKPVMAWYWFSAMSITLSTVFMKG